ncbi:Crp/Fnr family transcriptional regulator [Mucilaginibacter sp. HC2]|uniref:Crp/Fnr family transcriptional regulator n=1 Tax=Mucilaginibacter inviolabilis TaxID=2714892 RepID=UPI001407FEAF|nr:Crp/Fnr family transcriptional regulator [Mucilaginibacter inviolabilis]NHA05036.1 Crp/Fnr family transcriptional regulator [Mucilaginibacter inviolabilis]
MELLISTIKQLIPLSSKEETIVKTLFSELNLKSGEYLLRDGQVCKHVAFINKGLVRYFINNDGDERTMFFNKEGEFVCNYISFLPQLPSDKNIQALEATQLYVISYEKLQRFYQEINSGEKFGRVAIEQVFLSAIQQLDSLYTDSPEVRYQQFLNHYPDLTQRIPQYHIASYVGIKPQSLSRIRKRIFS